MEHRRYKCDFPRTLDIYGLVSCGDVESIIPMVYIRVNPHWYTVTKKNGQRTIYDPKIDTG